MALINPSDVTFSLVPEVTAGVLPTTGASRYEIPAKADQAIIAFDAAPITSNTKRPGRAANGSQQGMITGTGSLEMRLQAAPVFYTLMESALSGKFTTTGTKTLKAGTTDSTFSVLQLLQAGAAGSAMLEAASGAMVSKMTVTTKFGDEANISFDVLATSQSQVTTDSTLALTTVPAGAFEFAGKDVATITVAGNSTLQVTELSLEVTQDRVARGKLGTNTPLGIGTNGTRSVKLTVKAYRESFAVDTLVTGQAQSFSFTVGTAGNGYGFYIPAGYANKPRTEFDAESTFVTFEIIAGYDATQATDLYITQL